MAINWLGRRTSWLSDLSEWMEDPNPDHGNQLEVYFTFNWSQEGF